MSVNSVKHDPDQVAPAADDGSIPTFLRREITTPEVGTAVVSESLRQDQLTGHAAAIRTLGKRVINDLIEIGRRLTECRQIVGHGHWLAWLDREFGWSDRTALNFMRVYGMSLKSETVSDLKLPLGALYLLASPNVPETARTEILERAAAGDRLTSTEVKRVITDAKQAKTDDEIDPAGAEDVVVLRNWRTVTQTVVSAYLAHLDGQEPANDVDLDQRDDGHDLAGRSAKTDSRPEPETLIAHWQRDEEGRTALLDAVGAKAFRNAMSKEFSKALRAELPANPFAKLCEMDPGAIASRIFETVGATKSRVISEKLQALVLPKGKKPGKPSFKTLNLTANRAQERNRFRH